MATGLTSDAVTTDAVSYSVGAFTPSSNKVVIIYVAISRNDSVTPGSPTISGGTISFVELGAVDFKTAGGTSRARLVTYAGLSGSSPGSQSLTITGSGGVTHSGCVWSVSEEDTTGTTVKTTPAATTDAVVQVATNNNAATLSLQVTLGAFSHSSNRTFGGFARDFNELNNPGSGFTEIHDLGHISPAICLMTEWVNVNDTTVDASWATSSRAGGIAMEIKNSTAPTVVPQNQSLF